MEATLSISQQLWLLANQSMMVLDFVSHLLIFSGIALFVIFWRAAPQWHVTPLWYVGLSSFAIALTVAIEWVFGPGCPLSYYNLGTILETLFDLSLASLVVVFTIVYSFRSAARQRQQVVVEGTVGDRAAD